MLIVDLQKIRFKVGMRITEESEDVIINYL